MMLKKSLFLLVCWLGAPSLVAQQANDEAARRLLDDVNKAFAKAGGMRMDYVAKASGQATPIKGTLILQGSRFKLSTPETVTWFDGKTQWSYVSQTNEVTVTNPEAEELKSVSPSAWLSLYKTGYTASLGPDRSLPQGRVKEVVLTSVNKKEQFARVVLYIDPKQKLPVGVVLQPKGRNGGLEIVLQQLRTQLSLSEAEFRFQPADKAYAGADIIDLRM